MVCGCELGEIGEIIKGLDLMQAELAVYIKTIIIMYNPKQISHFILWNIRSIDIP